MNVENRTASVHEDSFIFHCLSIEGAYQSAGAVRFDTEGNLHPLEIEFDEEHKYPVDKVLDVCRAACQSVGGVGVRYTVRIQGHERYLWRERTKWFVEALK